MRILITNDDSVSASQLLPLIRWCEKLGTVCVVVPEFEQSGKSHAIELHKPFRVAARKLAEDVEVITVDSTPADCVRYAVLGMRRQYDLVISGINRGYNIGADILYSGTVAAVFEAAVLGIPAIALSTSPGYYDRAAEQLDRIWDYIQTHRLLEKHSLYNINIPPKAASIRITRQGGPYYSDDFAPDEQGYVTPVGKCVHVNSGDLTLDTDATISGHISITPMTPMRTDMAVYYSLKE